MGIVSILFLLLAAGTQPCSSAQLSSMPFPKLRSNEDPIPFAWLLPEEKRKKANCKTAEASKMVTAPAEGTAAAEELIKAALGVVECCTDKDPECVAGKKAYEDAAKTLADDLTASKTLVTRVLLAVKAIRKAATITYETRGVDAGVPTLASYWCWSRASFTAKTAATAKETIAKASCLTKQPSTPLLDTLTAGIRADEDKAGKDKADTADKDKADTANTKGTDNADNKGDGDGAADTLGADDTDDKGDGDGAQGKDDTADTKGTDKADNKGDGDGAADTLGEGDADKKGDENGTDN